MKATMKYHLTPSDWQKSESWEMPSIGRYVELWTPSCAVGGEGGGGECTEQSAFLESSLALLWGVVNLSIQIQTNSIDA